MLCWGRRSTFAEKDATELAADLALGGLRLLHARGAPFLARHTVSRTLKPATTVVVAIIQADHGRSLSVSGPS
eukprot:jgi/Tetstr1/442934/TSEL_030996.t1